MSKTSMAKGPFLSVAELSQMEGYSGICPVYSLGPYDVFDDTESYCILSPNFQANQLFLPI